MMMMMKVMGLEQQWKSRGTMLFMLLVQLVFGLMRRTDSSSLVDITIVHNVHVARGAVCLDGSPPAYHLDPGHDSGINNWLIQLEGGGWCNNETTCLSRKKTRLGSSLYMGKQLAFSGLLGNNPLLNPDFYNWNRVKIRYCDGSSFTGDVDAVNHETNLHFRGARVFLAVMADLLDNGLKDAENAILSGCSAGGLASILHCDSFSALLPMGAKTKCLADAEKAICGSFVSLLKKVWTPCNRTDISHAPHIEQFFSDIVTTHGSARNLPQSCTLRLDDPSLCFFPQNVVQHVRTPLFIINAAYDSWQIRNILAPATADPRGTWRDCKIDILNCTSSQLRIMQGYREQFLRALASGLGHSSSRGYFINSCYAHCQTEVQETWYRSDSPRLANKTIAKAVGDWFFDREEFKKIDCPYPCDRTCHNRVFDTASFH
ncbi:hypothetical protein DM860_013374 [Cuscuta australis]|uniref:Pectin acetylesterase n=1 Tax=Cuscuta australis TaxID=267555 RepID=A0A328DSN9_9ASTE|nr:hypothetical protein DM860_013374 [Cuscuta australis]